jgi:hypothetical protein
MNMNTTFQTSAPSSQISEIAKNTISNIESGLDSIKTGFNDTLKDYSSNNSINASQEFLQSNSLIVKFVFLIFVIAVFLFIMFLGINLIGYILSPSNSPYLVKGLMTGNIPVNITQNPKDMNSIILNRSNNEEYGAEFTWSVWLNVNHIGGATEFQHIFNKGDNYFTSEGITSVSNAPGVYLNTNNNTLRIIMNTIVSDDNDQNNIIDISNIPLKRWFNVIIRLEGQILDVYMNGVLTKRINLINVPKQNYSDVYICQNGGFNGLLSNLRYYSRALNVFEINNIVWYGPTLTSSKYSASSIKSGDYNYLSSIWYSSEM